MTLYRGITGRMAFELLYSSFLYSKLEQEQTKLWHLSPLTLANLLNEELETGNNALHTMGGFAIAEDIDSLIGGIKEAS